MRIYFDTEFIEDGKTIDLISIGLVREDGEELYLESSECELRHASDWVRENVFPHLQSEIIDGRMPFAMRRAAIRDRILAFVGSSPEFWAYYADYDWVVLCQLFGRMIDLPTHWPKWCRDLKQLQESVKPSGGAWPVQYGAEHHALADARWVRDAVEWFERNVRRDA